MAHLQFIAPAPGSDDPTFSREEVRAMQKAFVNLMDRWKVTDDQAAVLLGSPKGASLSEWRLGRLEEPGIDVETRLSNLMGIHKALRLLFREPERGYAWIKAPNQTFGGRSALDIMLMGRITDILRVRRYLDSARGPW